MLRIFKKKTLSLTCLHHRPWTDLSGRATPLNLLKAGKSNDATIGVRLGTLYGFKPTSNPELALKVLPLRQLSALEFWRLFYQFKQSGYLQESVALVWRIDSWEEPIFEQAQRGFQTWLAPTRTKKFRIPYQNVGIDFWWQDSPAASSLGNHTNRVLVPRVPTAVSTPCPKAVLRWFSRILAMRLCYLSVWGVLRLQQSYQVLSRGSRQPPLNRVCLSVITFNVFRCVERI